MGANNTKSSTGTTPKKSDPQPSSTALPSTRKSAVQISLESLQDENHQISKILFLEKLFTLPTEVDQGGHLHRLGELIFDKSDEKRGNGKVIECDVLVKFCERIHGIIDDRLAVSTYIYLYSDSVSNEKQEPLISKERFKEFLLLSLSLYFLSSDLIENSSDLAEKHVQAVVNAVFNEELGEEPKETRFVLKFLEEHLPNVTQHVHKVVVYRFAKGTSGSGVHANKLFLSPGDCEIDDKVQLMHYLKLWHLAIVFPNVPFFKNSPDKPALTRRPSYYLPGQDGQQPAMPSAAAWQLLYNSDIHGCGTNRFTHHVLGYRGPTVTLILAKDRKTNTVYEFCLGTTVEWKESSSTNFADKFACMAELRPQTKCLAKEKATPWLYFNAGTMRGQKKGLILGDVGEPPFFTLDESFDTVLYHKLSLHVIVIEVWGAGPEAARARQLDVKKWQIREAERQRVVKISADEWLDHPDRYLLEMSGRTNYVQKEKK